MFHYVAEHQSTENHLACSELAELVKRCPPPDWKAIIAIGLPDIRAKVFGELRGAGYSFATIISHYAVVETDDVGEGSVVFPGACLAIGARIGCDVVINYNAVIGHDTLIGAHSVISPGVNLGGWVVGGERVMYCIGSSCVEKKRI